MAKPKKDPIRKLLADLTPTPFLGNPPGTVAIKHDKVIDAGGDPDEVLAWIREHGGYADKSFGVSNTGALSMRPKPASKVFYVVPEDALKS